MQHKNYSKPTNARKQHLKTLEGALEKVISIEADSQASQSLALLRKSAGVTVSILQEIKVRIFFITDSD